MASSKFKTGITPDASTTIILIGGVVGFVASLVIIFLAINDGPPTFFDNYQVVIYAIFFLTYLLIAFLIRTLLEKFIIKKLPAWFLVPLLGTGLSFAITISYQAIWLDGDKYLSLFGYFEIVPIAIVLLLITSIIAKGLWYFRQERNS